MRICRRHRLLLSSVVVALVAFTLRLVPVLTQGGLYGLGNYDDAVHYAAAVGLIHGRLPYRDFLLLHPPGIVLALTPFALLGQLLGDAKGFAIARVAFMALGAGNAVLVLWALRSRGWPAAIVGSAFYAVFAPAVYAEHSTLLEALSNSCVLLALVLLAGPAHTSQPAHTSRPAHTSQPGRLAVLLAGMLLGASAGVKIWGVVGAAVVLVWVGLALGRRSAVRVALGIIAGVTAICLPFFLAAPNTMWQMVVRDQLRRPDSSTGIAERLSTIFELDRIGLATWSGIGGTLVLVVLGCVIAGWSDRLGRLAVALFIADGTVLLTSPSFFQHYAALTAAPLALVVGLATQRVIVRLRRRALQAVAIGALTAGLGLSVIPAVRMSFGQAFPTADLRAVAAAAPGCVTADDPTALIELGVLSRNLHRGCPLVVDLGGYSYHLQPRTGPFVARRANLAWQHAAVGYLRSGSVTVVLRFSSTFGFSRASAAAVARWPVVASSGPYALRHPQ